MRKIIPMHIKGEKSGSDPGTSKTECPILVQIKVMGDVDRRIQINCQNIKRQHPQKAIHIQHILNLGCRHVFPGDFIAEHFPDKAWIIINVCKFKGPVPVEGLAVIDIIKFYILIR